MAKKTVKKTSKVKKTKAPAKKKISTKKVAKKKAARPVIAQPGLQIVGEVTHYFPHVSAGVVKLSGGLKLGDMIRIKGHTTDFKQTVDSLQINHVIVNEAKRGDEIGLKAKDRVRIGDLVYKL